MRTHNVTDAQLRCIYEALCGTSFWLTPSTQEGEQVRNAVIRELRRLEDLLDLPADERLRSEVVEHK